MLITLSRRTAICQSVAEVYLKDMAPLRAVRNTFIFLNFNYHFIITFTVYLIFVNIL